MIGGIPMGPARFSVVVIKTDIDFCHSSASV